MYEATYYYFYSFLEYLLTFSIFWQEFGKGELRRRSPHHHVRFTLDSTAEKSDGDIKQPSPSAGSCNKEKNQKLANVFLNVWDDKATLPERKCSSDSALPKESILHIAQSPSSSESVLTYDGEHFGFSEDTLQKFAPTEPKKVNWFLSEENRRSENSSPVQEHLFCTSASEESKTNVSSLPKGNKPGTIFRLPSIASGTELSTYDGSEGQGRLVVC